VKPARQYALCLIGRSLPILDGASAAAVDADAKVSQSFNLPYLPLSAEAEIVF